MATFRDSEKQRYQALKGHLFSAAGCRSKKPAVISTRGSIAENQPVCYDQDATSTRTRERASIHILRFRYKENQPCEKQ
jgi:hypothetical protein